MMALNAASALGYCFTASKEGTHLAPDRPERLTASKAAVAMCGGLKDGAMKESQKRIH